MPDCPKSCDKEKLSIPLEAHHNAQSIKIFLSFPPKHIQSCNFWIFWAILLKLHISTSEMDSFLPPYGLSNSDEDKLQFIPFWGGPKPGCTVLHICSDVDPSRSPCLKTIDRKSFDRGNFLVLHPVLLKIAYFKSANLTAFY